MFKSHVNTPAQEPLASEHHHHLLCWKSTFAGVFITLMGFLVLTALGMGIAGNTAGALVENREGGSALLTGAGLWLGLSAVIALFCGSYFTLRISRFMTNKVGAAHGFVVASIFFLLLMTGAGNLLGGMVSGLGRVAQGAGSVAQDAAGGAAMSPVVQDTINKALGDAKFKSEPAVVAQGLAVRLLQGDVESAKSYYAYQSGLPQAEVDAKIGQLKADFDATVTKVGEKTASAVAGAGWTMFVVFMLGLISAMIGGRYGAQSNVARPFAASDRERERKPITPGAAVRV